ncbi:MAG: SDR family oxidoreductase, partial [Lentisphaeria bacterium]|nr:SDR family oxidoreductase [Lentisphaeria bacterium]
MDFDFTDQVVIATGAASGMAELYLKNLAELGAVAIFVDINADAVNNAAEEVRKKGGRAEAYVADIRKHTEVCAIVDDVIAKYGRIDCLLNSAGGASARVCKQPAFPYCSYESIEWGVDVNLKGAIFFARAVMPHMIEKKRGVIINMSSIDGITGSRGSVDYGAEKAGMVGLTKGLARIGGEHGIRSVSVAPGPVLTRPGMATMKTLLGRAAEVQEVVDLLVYLS